MSNHCEFGDLTDPGPKPTRLDIRVLYVRISNFAVDDSTPEQLTLRHTPIETDTILEVNNVRCPIDSDGISCSLRRDRVGKRSEEATFVCTDSTRFIGSVKFDVFDKEELVISGLLEISDNNNHTPAMNCESIMNVGTGFLKGKPESLLPTIEVYVAGCFSGTPVILTKTLQVGFRKKHVKCVVDSIPENDFACGHDLQVAEYRRRYIKGGSEQEWGNLNLYWRQREYMEGEDGEVSWFNAGVRVGVGIGLGICVGIGIGAGLLVRTYQSTTRNFKRRLR